VLIAAQGEHCSPCSAAAIAPPTATGMRDRGILLWSPCLLHVETSFTAAAAAAAAVDAEQWLYA